MHKKIAIKKSLLGILLSVALCMSGTAVYAETEATVGQETEAGITAESEESSVATEGNAETAEDPVTGGARILRSLQRQMMKRKV